MDEPNQGATGAVPADAEAAGAPPSGQAGASATDTINQGATGSRPLGETPLSAQTKSDQFAERPEVFVGAAFAGGLAVALILRRLAR